MLQQERDFSVLAHSLLSSVGRVEALMFWMLIALAIIAVTTLAMTTLAMLFMRWMLGLDQFLRSVKNPADTFHDDEASPSRAIS